VIKLGILSRFVCLSSCLYSRHTANLNFSRSTISRLLKITSLFCKRALLKRLWSQDYTLNFSKSWERIRVSSPHKKERKKVTMFLTRQACGQSSSMSAGSKCRAPGNYFSVRIYHAFLLSKYRADSSLVLCTFWVLVPGQLLRNRRFRFFLHTTHILSARLGGHIKWLWFVGSIKLKFSFAKEPYKRDNILQKRPTYLSILLTIATP